MRHPAYPTLRILMTGAGLFLGMAGLSGQIFMEFEVHPDGLGGMEAFQRGDRVTNQYQPYGVSFSGQRYHRNTLLDAELWIFDTANPVGGATRPSDGDPDLATPGFHPSNTKDLGFVMVVQQDTAPGSIPDDATKGGIITARFSEPVFIQSVEVLDLDRPGRSMLAGLDANLQPVFTFTEFPNIGDNSYNRIEFNEGAISTLVFNHRDSAALASITFIPIPEPETFIGMAGLLGLMAVMGRRWQRSIRSRRA